MKRDKIGNLLFKFHRKVKIPQTEYIAEGETPIVDQSSNSWIAGYTDNPEARHESPLPITVFGDHTRVVKYVNFPFASGADGTQLIYPNTEELDPTYFYYAVQNVDLSNYFYARHFKFLKEQEINLPKLDDQRRIAETLRAYDELIENNRRRMELLEESARLLYREWFVRLRFPGHEHTQISNGIPDGWERKTLGDVAENFDRRRVPLSVFERESQSGIYPYHGAAGILGYINDFLFDGRFLLVGEDGTVQTRVGTPMLQLVEGKFWVSNHAHVLRGEIVSTEFLHCLLSCYPISGHVTGVAQPKLTQANLNRIPVLVPTAIMRETFQDFVAPLFGLSFALQRQNQKLRAARDLLLPRLMSGEITL